jgi:PAS domain S-box-containing protein
MEESPLDPISPLHVLLVEDNEDDYIIVRDLLEDISSVRVEVDWVTTYEEARAALSQSQQERYDVCLLDYHLGGHTGLELLQELLREIPSGNLIPVIMVTGSESRQVDVAAAQAGASDYLIKGQINALLLERSIRYAIQRKATEAALNEALRRSSLLSTAVSNLTDGMIVTDAQKDDNPIVFVNSAFSAITGYAPEEILGRNCRCLQGAETDLRTVQEVREAVGQRRPFQGVLLNYRKDGTPFWNELKITPVFDEQGQLINFVGFLSDITERQQAEIALQESQANLATAQQIALLGSWELDLANPSDINSNALRWSDQTFRLIGYEPGQIEVTNENFFRSVHPEDRGRVAAAMEKAMRGEQPYHLEHRVIWPDGSERTVHAHAELIRDPVSGAPLKMVGMGQDITERIQNECAVRESEARSSAVIQHALDCIITIDHQGRVVEWNPAAEATFGYARGEALGQDLNDLIVPPAFHEGHTRGIAHYLETGEGPLLNRRVEVTARHKSGADITVELATTAIKRSGSPLFTASLRDITAQKQTEARQAALLQGLNTVVAVADELLALVDLDTLLRQAVELAREKLGLERCSIYLLQQEDADMQGTYGTDIHGRTIDERDIRVPLSGHWAAPLLRGDFSQINAPRWFLEPAHEQVGSDASGDDKTIHRLGKIGWVAATPIFSARRAIGVFFNDTAISDAPVDEISQELLVVYCSLLGNAIERKQAEEQLRITEERSRTLLQSLPHGVFFKDVNYSFVSMNQSLAERFGITPEDAVGKTDWDILPSTLAEKYRADDERVLLTRRPEVIEETSVMGGEARIVEVSKSPVIADDGTVRGILGLVTDITERKQAEEALRRAKDELELRVAERTVELDRARTEAERANAAKSEFLSRMSHELRTPLNAILGFGQILEMQPLAPRQHESVNHILKGGQHLLSLINEVLDLARVEAGRMELSLEPVELRDVVTECCSLLRPLADERQITLSYHLVVLEETYVLADRQRLKQVLVNLLSNAIKYNHMGGSVDVLCEPQSSGRIRLLVRDTGVGIAPEKLPRLFVPFERLGAEKTGIEGTGLGLALCKSLTEAMGGSIGLDSTPGTGSTAWIELSTALAPLAPKSQLAVAPFFDSPSTSRTILLIEDNLTNLRLIEHILADQPEICLLSAMQGQLGLELAQKHQPHLILLDLHLPDIMGDEVLHRLQADAATASIPVVVVSADATPSQVERLKAAGAQAYLTKPLNLAQFLQTVREALH